MFKDRFLLVTLPLSDTKEELHLFLLAVAGLDEHPASTGLSSELTVTETTQVRRPGRPRKYPRNSENRKLMLIQFPISTI